MNLPILIFLDYIFLFFFSDDFAAAAAANVVTSTNNDNNKLNNKSCDPDTCSIIESISTNVPCTKGGGGGGSRTSSHISIPGLDWDSQVSPDFSMKFTSYLTALSFLLSSVRLG